MFLLGFGQNQPEFSDSLMACARAKHTDNLMSHQKNRDIKAPIYSYYFYSPLPSVREDWEANEKAEFINAVLSNNKSIHVSLCMSKDLLTFPF